MQKEKLERENIFLALDFHSDTLDLSGSHVQANILEFLTLYLKELIGQCLKNKVSEN